MTSQDIEITFRYRTFDATDWKTLSIAPEDYFEMCDHTPGERIDIYLVEKHLDVRKFLDVPRELVWQIQIRVNDPVEYVEHVNEFTYFNKGRCVLIRREDSSDRFAKTRFTLQVVVDASQTTATVKFVPTEDGHLLQDYSVNINSELAEVLPEHERAVRHGIL